MKKLMIAAAIVCAAAMSQAANFQWSCSYSVATAADPDLNVASATAYLIDAGVLTQAQIYSAVSGGASLDDAVAGKYVYSSPLSDGFVPSEGSNVKFTDTSYAGGDYHTFYMTLVDGDNLYFSEELADVAIPTGEATVALNYTNDMSIEGLQEWATFDTTAGGWVNVPEPTSGLLLLIGVAGLALRRRRA